MKSGVFLKENFRILPTNSDMMHSRFLSITKDFFHMLLLINMQNIYGKKKQDLSENNISIENTEM